MTMSEIRPELAFGLKDQTFLVTGSSRGIGKSIALALGRAGANVGVTYTGSSPSSEANALAVRDAIQEFGGKAIASPLDVSNETQVNETVEKVVRTFGSLQGLVNNAGIVIDQIMMRYKTEDFDKLMDINLKGTFMVSRASLRPLMKNGGGSIVNMSSVVGLMGNPGQVPYCASKAAVIGMSKAMAREYGAKKIRVNCVAPGFIETDMTHSLKPGQRDELTRNIPLNCLGHGDDIALGTLFLLSPMSRYITGEVLNINGGLYM